MDGGDLQIEANEKVGKIDSCWMLPWSWSMFLLQKYVYNVPVSEEEFLKNSFVFIHGLTCMESSPIWVYE